MSTEKLIRFEGREYHCLSVDFEPWNHPEVGLRAPDLKARLPYVEFTPVRWRFVCREGVIAAVPLGFFDGRRPERIPAEISRITAWNETTRPVSDEERALYWHLDPEEKRGVLPPPEAQVTVEDEYGEFMGYLAARLPGQSADTLNEIMELADYRATYDDGSRDYFIRVEVCELAGDGNSVSASKPILDELTAEVHELKTAVMNKRKPSKRLSAKRAAAARDKRKVQDEGDRLKIEVSFRKKVNEQHMSCHAAAGAVAAMALWLRKEDNILGLSRPYVLSSDDVKRIAKVKK